ncbi:MAG: hypothetical protein U0838_17115 [Chloroflexota bacterium]
MELLIVAVIAIFLLGAFDALASEVGVDSRDLSDDPHRSTYPVSLN